MKELNTLLPFMVIFTLYFIWGYAAWDDTLPECFSFYWWAIYFSLLVVYLGIVLYSLKQPTLKPLQK